MQIGMVGLGRMGGNMCRRLMTSGHECVVYDLHTGEVDTLVKDGATGARSLEEFVHTLSAPRAVWIMVPSGKPTEDTVNALSQLLQPGDAMIDGGNSFYKDDVRRSTMLTSLGIDYLDVGTSGGVWGLERGYYLMIGGSQKTAERLDPIFAALAPGPGDIPRTPAREGRQGSAEQGYLYVGASGAGHFVKMLHNGIEYG
ncbi:MAG: NAD(P)-binding domain-containing protein, partial [Gemmatimonadota bacterium]|nr:NAD(P)-binding domain-containing protein [Gemmatimonadota bacterium]